MNRLDFEKDKGSIKCTANEGTTVQKIAREKIETQISSKQNGKISFRNILHFKNLSLIIQFYNCVGKITEYSKSDKSTHNKYFYYDE